MKDVNLCRISVISEQLRFIYLTICFICLLQDIASQNDPSFDPYAMDYMNDRYPIFTSFDQLMKRLDLEGNYHPQLVMELKGILKKYYPNLPSVDPAKGRRAPFIAIEGKERSMKEALTQKVATLIGATDLKMPTGSIKRVIQKIPATTPLKHLFFFISLYTTSHEVNVLLKKGVPVLITGYYNHQAAFCIEKSYSTIPNESCIYYNHPTDLLKPDLVIYLDHKHEFIKFDRENKIKLKTRFKEIYSRFRNPSVIIYEIKKKFQESSSDLVKIIVDNLNGTMDLNVTVDNKFAQENRFAF